MKRIIDEMTARQRKTNPVAKDASFRIGAPEKEQEREAAGAAGD